MSEVLPQTLDEALACIAEHIEAREDVRASVRVLAGFLQNSYDNDALSTLLPTEASTLSREQGLHRSGMSAGIAALCDKLTDGSEIGALRESLREEQGEKA